MNNLIKRLWNNFPMFVVLYLYMFLPVFFEAGTPIDVKTIVVFSALQPFIVAFFLTLLASYSKVVKCLIMIFSSLFFTLEVFCYFNLSTRFSNTVAILMFQTDFNEAFGFMSDRTTIISLIQTLSSILFILSLYIIADHNWFKIQEKTKNIGLQIIPRNKSRNIFCGALTLLFVICCVFSSCDLYYVKSRFYSEYWQRISVLQKATTPVLYLGIIEDLIESGDTEKYNRIEDSIDNTFVGGATIDSLQIVYVIGESCIKERLSLYGYFLNTTPFLLQEFQKGNIVKFNNVVTPSPRTIEMFPKLMTIADIDDGVELVDHPLLPAIIKKSGYHVSYFDNQTTKRDIKKFDFGCSSFISKPSILRKSVDSTNDSTFNYDLDFVKRYQVDTDFDHSLTIYHLMGQHVAAAARFPGERAKFVAHDYLSISEYTEEMRIDVADYDNAILEMDLSTVSTPSIDKKYSLLSTHNGRDKRILRGNFNYDDVEHEVNEIKLYYQR